MTFEDFLESGTQCAWLDVPLGLSIYVRRSRIPARGDVELANMNAAIPGQGALTLFLDTWEPHVSFYVENVLNRRLVHFLLRRGYVNVNPDDATGDYPPCMLKMK